MTKKLYPNGITFIPKVPTYTPPVIVDQFCDDDGEINYVLANGNTTLQTTYNSIWHPAKGIVNMSAKDAPIGNKQGKY